MKEKARSPKVFVYESNAEGFRISDRVKLSGWIENSQKFRQIEWVSFRERIVVQG